MIHPIHRVRSFEKVGPHILRIKFDDETERTIDFLPVLKGKLYGPLRDPILFDQVFVDREVHTLVWSSGADFDPTTLHNWPEHVEALIEATERWGNEAATVRKSA